MKKTLTIIGKTITLVALSPVIILAMAGSLATTVAEAIMDCLHDAKAAAKTIFLG